MSEKKLSLEETMNKIEQLAQKLDSDKLSLEESIDVFEEGVKLTSHAKKLLNSYEKRISILKKTADGVAEQDMEEDNGI